jgi:pilus assembly protein Flp/PilA
VKIFDSGTDTPAPTDLSLERTCKSADLFRKWDQSSARNRSHPFSSTAGAMERGMYQPHLVHDESGQTMAEYAVTLGVITLAVIAAFTLLGTTTATLIGRVISAM